MNDVTSHNNPMRWVLFSLRFYSGRNKHRESGLCKVTQEERSSGSHPDRPAPQFILPTQRLTLTKFPGADFLILIYTKV